MNETQHDQQNEQKDSATATEQVKVQKPIKASSAGNGSGSWIPAISMFTLLLSLFLVYRTEFSTASAEGIYVVDGLRLTRSYQLMSKNDRNNGVKSPEQINNEAFKMEQAINSKIAEMAGDGKIIVQKQSVWAYPPESDITAEIAAAVGLTLAQDNEPLPQQQNLSGNANSTVPGSLPEESASQAGGADLD